MHKLRKSAWPGVGLRARGSTGGFGQFKLLTNHKALVPLINNQDLDNTPLRCHRLLMRLMRYNVKAEYSPEKTLVVSDTLSRSPINDPPVSSTEEDVNFHIESNK